MAKAGVLLVALLLLLAAGAADARSAVGAAKGKPDPGETPRRQDPRSEPEPAPEPAPVPEPEPAPPGHAASDPAPPPAAPEPTESPAPPPDAPQASQPASAPASAPDVATGPAAAPSAEDDAPQPARVSAPVEQPPALVVPIKNVRTSGSSGIQGAASLPASPGSALLWGLGLGALVAFGLVLSSGRLLHPAAPLPRRAAGAPEPVSAEALDVPAMLRAAKAAVEAMRYEEAIAWFDRALVHDAKLAVAHYCRGVCLVGLGRHEEAYDSFRSAFELDPTEAVHRLELARACGRTGRAAEAMDVLGALLRAFPHLAGEVSNDEAFASLRDHPRFWGITGRL